MECVNVKRERAREEKRRAGKKVVNMSDELKPSAIS